MAPGSEKPPSSASTATSSAVRAVASLIRPSPSMTVSSRCGRPTRRPMAIAATASGGDRTAPRATPAASGRSGTTAVATAPTVRAETRTSTTDSSPTGAMFARMSSRLAVSAAEYSSGGITCRRMTSGSSLTFGPGSSA